MQHDGVPAHKARMIKTELECRGIEVMNWAAQSPDLNPIKYIWAFIKKILGNMRFNSYSDLKNEIIRIWNEQITPNFVVI